MCFAILLLLPVFFVFIFVFAGLFFSGSAVFFYSYFPNRLCFPPGVCVWHLLLGRGFQLGRESGCACGWVVAVVVKERTYTWNIQTDLQQQYVSRYIRSWYRIVLSTQGWVLFACFLLLLLRQGGGEGGRWGVMMHRHTRNSRPLPPVIESGRGGRGGRGSERGRGVAVQGGGGGGGRYR